ncbi:MAG: hypothetical protein LEGION0398_MBIBDBAK_00596 [Legionellaceae bacterium]
MPIYEYECSDCKHHLEVIQKLSDQPLVECPSCYKDTLNRLISATRFELKGTGWYVTDFKDKPKNKASTEPSTHSETNNATGSTTET